MPGKKRSRPSEAGSKRARQLAESVAGLAEYAARALVAARQLRIKTKPVKGLRLSKGDRAGLAALPGLAPKLKKKLAKPEADHWHLFVPALAIVLAPLKERREDIPTLVEHFLTTRQVGPRRLKVDPQAMQALTRYDWPGNVRELANVLERAQTLAEGDVITPDDLPDGLVAEAPESAGGEPGHLREVERRHVHELLRQHKGNKVHAARALGVSRRALYRLISRYHLEGDEGGEAARAG
jgi:hypothetical protein